MEKSVWTKRIKPLALILICATLMLFFTACKGSDDTQHHVYISGWPIETDTSYYITEYKDLPEPNALAGWEFLGYYIHVTANNADAMIPEVKKLIDKEIPYNRKNMELLINGTTTASSPVTINLQKLYAPIGGRVSLNAWQNDAQDLKQARVAEINDFHSTLPPWSGGIFKIKLETSAGVEPNVAFKLFINGILTNYSEETLYNLNKGDFLRITILKNGEEARLANLSITLTEIA